MSSFINSFINIYSNCLVAAVVVAVAAVTATAADGRFRLRGCPMRSGGVSSIVVFLKRMCACFCLFYCSVVSRSFVVRSFARSLARAACRRSQAAMRRQQQQQQQPRHLHRNRHHDDGQ